jgi:hypothetical protein
MFHDAIDQCRELASISEGTFLDSIKDLGQAFIELVCPIDMPVAEILDILSEVTKQEDVVLADLASNLNLQELLIDAP